MKIKIGLMFVFTLMLLLPMFTFSIPNLSNAAAKSSKDGVPAGKSSMNGEFVVDEYTLALWHFNEGQGQVVHDESPHHNDGMLGPTLDAEDSDPSWVSGFTNSSGDYALSFDQWNDYVIVPDNPDGSLDLQLLPQFTIEFWTYLRQISRADRGTGQHWNRFLQKVSVNGSVNVAEDLCGYGVEQSSFPQPTPWFSFGVMDYGATKNWGVSCIPPPLNQWVLVSIVYDGNYSRIYFNDVIQSETLVGSLNFTDNTAPLTIGKWVAEDWPWLDSIDGIIDEVRFSSIARDSSMYQHDVAISNLTCCKTVVGQGYAIYITVTVENRGNATETFNVTAYYNQTAIMIEQWPDDTNSTFWSMGDVNRDGYIDNWDLYRIKQAYGTRPGDLKWDPDADLDSNGKVGLSDLARFGNNSGKDIWTSLALPKLMEDQRAVTLPGGNSTIITLRWNTTDIINGNYTISAYACPVPGETDTSDNAFTGGMIYVGILGDINGDGTVNILDAIILSNAFLSTPYSPNWSANADINSDGIVDILDAIILSNNFLQHYP
jgi:hypothetical protein